MTCSEHNHAGQDRLVSAEYSYSPVRRHGCERDFAPNAAAVAAAARAVSDARKSYYYDQ